MQDGFSALYAASEAGHTEVVDTLLTSGADPNLATKVWGLYGVYITTHLYAVFAWLQWPSLLGCPDISIG